MEVRKRNSAKTTQIVKNCHMQKPYDTIFVTEKERKNMQWEEQNEYIRIQQQITPPSAQ